MEAGFVAHAPAYRLAKKAKHHSPLPDILPDSYSDVEILVNTPMATLQVMKTKTMLAFQKVQQAV